MSDLHAHTVTYVRETMLPQKAPPVAQKGAIKWVRENLFSSWLNIFLTVVALSIVYWALALVMPWAFGGVWNAGSLTECREALFAVYKSSHGGACWAVIEDRWLQILFGFYPPELYWRPILALVLFFVALAPVLFAEKVPGQLIYFSMAYPFIAVWLIWGGAFWSPLLVALGFVAAVVAYKVLSKVSGPIVANLGALVAALFWWGAIVGPVNDGLNKAIGSSRFDSTVATLEQQAVDLPAEVTALDELGGAKAAEIAEQVAIKDGLIESMREIRVEEFAVAVQYEAKEDAFQRLNAAQESLENAESILDDWDGAPVAASGATEAEVSEAEDAATDAAKLMDDATRLIGAAVISVNETAEPTDVADGMVSVAAGADASILEDVDALVTKETITEPLMALQERAAALTPETSASDIAAVRADINTVMASVSADIETLHTIEDKIIATNVEPLKAPQAALDDQRATLAALRDEATVIAQDRFRVSTVVSESRGFLNSIKTLDDRESSVPDLKETATSLREALPRDYRDMIAVNQLPEEATPEDQNALAAYLNANREALSVEASVAASYADLGRVGLRPIESRQIGGFMLALIIGIAGIVLSLPLGILLALGRQSHLFIVNKICVTFIEVIRGVPLIVWLFTGSLLLNYFLPPGTSFDLLLRVIIMVTLFAAAYIAEVIRGGLAALPTGQYEGADSLGLSYWQSMQLIVLPQALKISIPGIVNTFIGLFKDTVLVVFIGLLDPIGFLNLIRADTDWNGVYWEPFVFIGVLFFIFCFSMGRYSLYLERKLQREHR